jgi:geranylgeranyl transferase type-1 subunit beta
VIVQDILHWLVSRQTSLLKEESEGEGEEEDGESEPEGPIGHHHNHHQSTNVKQFGNLLPIPPVLEAEALPLDFDCAGFNGRCNKPADTCYSFWVGASLGVSLKFENPNHKCDANIVLFRC